MSEPLDENTEPSTTISGAIPPASGLFHGRRVLYSPYEEVTEHNVVEILDYVESGRTRNHAEIDYLWNYYKGKQPILSRIKLVRPEINNKVVENHAQEIVKFKIGYQLAEPLQYTCRNTNEAGDSYEAKLKEVNELNTLMFAEDKASCDRDLFEWMCVAGVGYRFNVSDEEFDIEDGSAPFEIYTLDSRRTFVVLSPAYHHRVLLGVWIGMDIQDGVEIFNVYTDNHFYQIKNGSIIKDSSHTYKHIPIVEYQLNNARMGVFEPVLPLLDAINIIESNRLDGIEQTIQALIKFINVDIDEDGFREMLELGAIKVTARDGIKGDVDVIKNDLDQTQTQVTKDDLYQAVVNICGMPNRNGTSGSSSDTGAAVLLRDGWSLAESHAKDYELQIKKAERNSLRVILEICRQSKDCAIKNLKIRDIELAFNRRNYENILVKAQVLTTMLKSNQIHPQLAFQSCGMFTDPEAAYTQSKEYNEEGKAALETITKQADGGTDDNDPDDAKVNEQKDVGSQAGVPEPKQ